MTLRTLNNQLFEKFELKSLNLIWGGITTREKDSTACGPEDNETVEDITDCYCSKKADDVDPV